MTCRVTAADKVEAGTMVMPADTNLKEAEVQRPLQVRDLQVAVHHLAPSVHQPQHFILVFRT